MYFSRKNTSTFITANKFIMPKVLVFHTGICQNRTRRGLSNWAERQKDENYMHLKGVAELMDLQMLLVAQMSIRHIQFCVLKTNKYLNSL